MRCVYFAVLLLVVAMPTAAQLVPFGKNKIQYDDFDWRIISGEHVDVYYYPEEEAVARLALAYAEESYDSLEVLFQHHPFQRIPLIVYSSDQHFEQTNLLPGFIPEGVLGFTEYLKRRVALPFRGDYQQFRHTLRHELVHAYQLSKLSETSAVHARRRRFSPQQIHWWTEGLAENFSSEQTAEDEMFVRDLVVNGRLPDIESFSYSYTFMSYPLGGELHRYLAERFGSEYVVRMYEDHWRYPSFEDALEAILGVDIDRLSREWKYDLEQRFFPQYAERPPLDVGAHVVLDEGGANFKPVVFTAPGDTTIELLFTSPRTGYTNLYRTSLRRGEDGIRTILEGERTAEFESFHAYSSGPDVSRNGIIAFSSKFMERDALVLWDLERREVVGRYQWDDLVGVRSPSWDPTGAHIVFEGLSTSGFSDLYRLDFATQQRTALTADRYRDFDPAWSPDGSTIVFASDRSPHGEHGYTNLIALDAASGSMRYLTYGPWNDAGPSWSFAGDRIAFSSDRSGFYDIYAIDTQGNGERLTAFTGGAFDPVWLPGDRGILFAGYANSQFLIYQYSLDADGTAPTIALSTTAGSPPHGAPLAATTTASMDAPAWRWHEVADTVVQRARPYESLNKISIDFAAADAIVAPGVGAAQGAQFVASDMLGNHLLLASVSAVQADDLTQLVDNFSGNLVYLNLSRRLNYGAGIFRYKGLFRDVSFDVYDEEVMGAYFLGSYPFSKFRRIELQLGLERSDRVDVEDGFEDGILGGTTRPDLRDLTRSGTLSSNFLSYVKDNTLWIETGPIDGERYNLSAGVVSCFACESPSAATGRPVTRQASAENFVLTGDYRRYLRTSLYSSYAVRAYAFYSGGAIPGRAVLGGPHRLRGYPRYSLAGSRVWLLNQEWRFPILHGLDFNFPFGSMRFPGIQGGIFADAGSSWLETEDGQSGVWGSYGLSLRSAIVLPVVLRVDIGRRFHSGDRPPVVFGGDEEFGDTFFDFFIGFNY